MEGVDYRATKGNHVAEVVSGLGIEAARDTIASEIKFTMESHGMSVDARHTQLLADCMTCKVRPAAPTCEVTAARVQLPAGRLHDLEVGAGFTPWRPGRGAGHHHHAWPLSRCWAACSCLLVLSNP